MSESINPGEKPVNDGGTAPQPDPPPAEEFAAEEGLTDEDAPVDDKPVNDGGGSVA